MDHVLHNCINWNKVEMDRALRDSENDRIAVPRYAFKLVGKDRVPLTADEYREQRHNDAWRYSDNIEAMRRRSAT